MATINLYKPGNHFFVAGWFLSKVVVAFDFWLSCSSRVIGQPLFEKATKTTTFYLRRLSANLLSAWGARVENNKNNRNTLIKIYFNDKQEIQYKTAVIYAYDIGNTIYKKNKTVVVVLVVLIKFKNMAEEKTVENYLVKKIEALGGQCIKFIPTFYAGFPDRIVLLSGARIIFVELKAKNGVVSAIQKVVHKRLRALGFRVEVLNSRSAIDVFILSVCAQ